MNLSDEQIRAYLRSPSHPQERLNALGVHSLGSIQEERQAEAQAAVRAADGRLDIPVGSGYAQGGRL